MQHNVALLKYTDRFRSTYCLHHRTDEAGSTHLSNIEEAKTFLLAPMSRPALKAQPAFYPMGTGAKALLDSDDDNSASSSAEVKNE
jgi:hypothetical protein